MVSESEPLVMMGEASSCQRRRSDVLRKLEPPARPPLGAASAGRDVSPARGLRAASAKRAVCTPLGTSEPSLASGLLLLPPDFFSGVTAGLLRPAQDKKAAASTGRQRRLTKASSTEAILQAFNSRAQGHDTSLTAPRVPTWHVVAVDLHREDRRPHRPQRTDRMRLEGSNRRRKQR